MRPISITAAALLASAGLAACTTPHRDAVVFGTSTVIGVDVEFVSDSGYPDFGIGYERQEAVLMPLLQNGRDSRLAMGGLCVASDSVFGCLQQIDRLLTAVEFNELMNEFIQATRDNCRTAFSIVRTPAIARLRWASASADDRQAAENCINAISDKLPPYHPYDGGLYRGSTVTTTGHGTAAEVRTEYADSYSVFASLGARIRARGRASPTDDDYEGEAAVGIAQFFATGIAAQELGRNERVNEALAIQPGAVATVAANEEIDKLEEELANRPTEEDIRMAEERGRQAALSSISAIDWANDVSKSTDLSFGQAIAATGPCQLSPNFRTALEGASDAAARRQLVLNRAGSPIAAHQADIRALGNFINDQCG